jgi:ribosomal protein S18 acetylase RimI-like enzyme
MTDIVIRKMQEKDKEALMDILHLADPHGQGHPVPELIYKRWGAYYFEECRDHCFVAADPESDRAVGVILCAPDTLMYQKIFNEKYYKSIRMALKEMKQNHPGAVTKYHMAYYRRREGSLLNFTHPLKMKQIYSEYPAHLHINIHPDFQRQGIGQLLVDRLLSHLKEKGIRGLHLIVAFNNQKGIGFYRKYGFSKLLDIFPAGKSGIIYGVKTTEKR